jgi:hypothetical protein
VNGVKYFSFLVQGPLYRHTPWDRIGWPFCSARARIRRPRYTSGLQVFLGVASDKRGRDPALDWNVHNPGFIPADTAAKLLYKCCFQLSVKDYGLHQIANSEAIHSVDTPLYEEHSQLLDS